MDGRHMTTQEAVDVVLGEIGGRYLPLAEVIDLVAALLGDEPDPEYVADAMRDLLDDPLAGEDERTEKLRADRDVEMHDPEWAARMAHYRGDTRSEVAF